MIGHSMRQRLRPNRGERWMEQEGQGLAQITKMDVILDATSPQAREIVGRQGVWLVISVPSPIMATATSKDLPIVCQKVVAAAIVLNPMAVAADQ